MIAALQKIIVSFAPLEAGHTAVHEVDCILDAFILGVRELRPSPLPKAVKRARDYQDVPFGGHPQDQVLILPEYAFFAIPADPVEGRAAEHDRAVREGEERGLSL